MAIKTKAVLQGQSTQIRDEVIDNANTATRVGTNFLDIVDSKASNNDGSGLTYDIANDKFILGGTLSQAANINAAGYAVSFSGGSYTLASATISFVIGTGLVITDLRATPLGMQYAADYSPTYGDRSIPDWKAVKDYADGKSYNINDLGDVDTTGLTSGMILEFNGSKFVPITTPVSGGGGGTTYWAADGSNIFYQAGNVEVRDGKEFKIYDSGTTDAWSFSVDANNNLIVTGPTNANAHFSGDVIAFSSLTPPAASWWDDIPVDGTTIHLNVLGQLEVIGGGGGVSDHGLLTGLADDDHPQYHNDTRGDARYSLLSHIHAGIYAPVVHTHVEADITDLDKYWVKTGNDIAYSLGEVQVKAGNIFRLYDSTNTDSWTFNVDSNNHLVLTGPTNANLHVSGDVIAYSSVSPPAASWWDDIPVDGTTIHLNVLGQLEVIGGGGGVSDHGALTGLADDDHTQYHTDARGDARYSLLSHVHTGIYAPIVHTHSYLPLAGGTLTGALTLSLDGTDVINFSANSANDNRGISFNGRTGLSADYNDTWLRLNNLSEFTSGIYTPGNLRVDGILLVDGLGRGLTDVTGSYGNVQTYGSGIGSWQGYNINGDAVFMSNVNGYGLYDDTNNKWGIYCERNAQTQIYHNGSTKLATSSTGVTITDAGITTIGSTAANAGVHFYGVSTENNLTGITWGGSSSSTTRAQSQAGIMVKANNGYGTTMHFATTDSYTAGQQERMTILYDGKVGIGIPVPAYALDVYSPANYEVASFANPAGKIYLGINSLYTTKNYLMSWGATNYTNFGIKTATGEPQFVFDTAGTFTIRGSGTNSPILYENTTSPYGQLVLGGGSRGGWYGMRIGSATENATLMSTSGTVALYWADVYEYGFSSTKNGATTLYHNGSGKIATSSVGVTVVGGVYASGEVESFDTSDIRLKENIEELDNTKVAKDMLNLKAVRYDHKKKNKKEIGLIAQEVKEIFPEVVKEDDEGMLMIQYGKLVPALLATIKSLEKRISQLEKNQ